MLGYLPVGSIVAFVSVEDGGDVVVEGDVVVKGDVVVEGDVVVKGDVVVEGDVVVVRDSTEYSASNPRATVFPGWNITNNWFPVKK